MYQLELGGIKMKKINVLQLIKEKQQKEERRHKALLVNAAVR